MNMFLPWVLMSVFRSCQDPAHDKDSAPRCQGSAAVCPSLEAPDGAGPWQQAGEAQQGAQQNILALPARNTEIALPKYKYLQLYLYQVGLSEGKGNPGVQFVLGAVGNRILWASTLLDGVME